MIASISSPPTSSRWWLVRTVPNNDVCHGVDGGAHACSDPQEDSSAPSYGNNPVVASFATNAPTISTTKPMTTKVVNGLISMTILIE